MDSEAPVRIRIPERHKRPGLCYAVTSDGIELPVIDVTHPAFAFNPTEDEFAEITERTLRGFERGAKWPAFLLRLMASRSLVMRNVMKASGSYLDGVATYVHKLGPENVGKGWGTSLDRKLLRTIGPTSMRLRLRDLARLLAGHLAGSLGRTPGRGVCFLNIAGGTAIDSLNGLLVTTRQCPGLLAGRRIAIHVLDPDRDGAAFGARALAALTAAGGPLAGLTASLERRDYDWRTPETLRAVVEETCREGELVIACSEGGLFEYGTDADVSANLKVLREVLPADSLVAGSVLLDGVVGRAMVKYGRIPLRLREPASLAALAASTGWTVSLTLDAAGVYQTLGMLKAAPDPKR